MFGHNTKMLSHTGAIENPNPVNVGSLELTEWVKIGKIRLNVIRPLFYETVCVRKTRE